MDRLQNGFETLKARSEASRQRVLFLIAWREASLRALVLFFFLRFAEPGSNLTLETALKARSEASRQRSYL